ncbi:MAG TPA: hypothetical protein VHC40_07635 [Rhizomicrobium sp.]|nr:hypothetical protein [Rhizomicrobium sp.]
MTFSRLLAGKFLGRAGAAALCAMALSACAGKTYFSSELGQGGGPGGLTTATGPSGSPGPTGPQGATGSQDTAGTQGPAGEQGPAGPAGATGAQGPSGPTGPAGATGATGPAGTFLGSGGVLSNGLGITGANGVTSSLLGSDVVGGAVNSLLGSDNAVSQITGTPTTASGQGLVPKLATQLQTGTTTPTAGAGLGGAGDGGLVSDVIGSDALGMVTGDTGVIGANLAGGNDGLLGSVIGAAPLLPQAGTIVNQVPLGKVTAAVKPLGISGAGGLVSDLTGIDPVTNLVGSNGAIPAALGGGDAGALGKVVTSPNPPLSIVGETVNTVLGAVAGTSPSPVGGVLNAGAPNGGSGAAGNLPVADLPVASLPVVGSVAASVQPAVKQVLPIVTGTVGTITAAAPAANAVTSLTSKLGSAVSALTGATGKTGLSGLLGKP